MASRWGNTYNTLSLRVSRANELVPYSKTSSRARLHNSKASTKTSTLHRVAISYGVNGLRFPNNFLVTLEALVSMRGMFLVNTVSLVLYSMMVDTL